MWNELKLLILAVFLIAIAAGLFQGLRHLTPARETIPAPQVYSPTAASTTPVMPPVPDVPVSSTTTPPVATDSGIVGTAMIGPTCPVMRMPPDPGCSDKSYKGQFIISSSDPTRNFGYLVTSDVSGKFSFKLPPGSYDIRLSGAAAMPSMQPQDFVVRAHQYATLSLKLDSGIR